MPEMPSDGARPQVAADGADKGHGAKSDAVRERAIMALLVSPSVADAAKRAGIGTRTLRRWLTGDEAFQRDLAAARRAAFDAGMGRVQALAAQAVDALEELLADRDRPSVRLGAARTLVELAVHRHDADVLVAKLADIEQRLETRGRW